MKFVYNKKAQDYIKRKNIDKIFIREDIESSIGCCSISTIKLNISTKGGNEENYKKEESDLVTTYYDPRLESLLVNCPQVVISVFGLRNKKSFFTETEFSPLNS